MYTKLVSFVIFFGFLLFFFAFPVSAQVVINEISPSEEWVELYNTNSTEVSLEGCILLMGSPTQDVNYTAADIISGSGFLVAEKSVTTEWTTNWLNNSGDSVSLSCQSVGSDSINYGSEVDAKTYGRNPNGTGSFVVLESATKGLANSAPNPTPTPTPISTATPTPTATPNPTSSPAPTKTPSPTPKPISTKKPTSSPSSQEGEEEVLGFRNELTSEKSPTPSPEVLGDAKRNFPLAAVFFLLGGGVFIGLAGFSFFKQRRVNYTGESEKESNDTP